MKTYKLFRIRNGKLFPLYVEANREMEVGKWLRSGCGVKVDDTHVKASGCGGKLSLRSGFHSTHIPFTDWIGKKTEDGTLVQREDTVWCECEVRGNEVKSPGRFGYREIPRNTWYFFKTNSRQKDPWIISDWLKINRILSRNEVVQICKANGVVAQAIA